MDRAALALVLLPVALAMVAGPSAKETDLVEALGTIFFNQVGLLEKVEAQGNSTTDISMRIKGLEEIVADYLSQDSTFYDEMSIMRSSIQNLSDIMDTHIQIGKSIIRNENSTRHVLMKLYEQEQQIEKLGAENEGLRTEKEQLREETNSLQSQNSQLLADLLSAEEESREVREDLRKVEEDKRKADDDRRKVEEDKRKVEDDRRKVEEDKRKVEEDNRQLEEDLREVRDQLRQQENRTHRGLEELQEAVLQLGEEKAQLESGKAQLEREKAQLEEECGEEAAIDCRRRATEAGELEAQILALEEENRRLVDAIKRDVRPNNCDDHYCRSILTDGVYNVFPTRESAAVPVYCDMKSEAGGWTTFLRRQQQIPQEDFARPWAQYKEGFGDPSAEHWMGLETLHALTESSSAKLRLEAMSFDGIQRWAEWDTFSVGNESSGYKLTVGDYDNNSTMGDPLTSGRVIDGRPFSTMDRDQDILSLDCVDYYSRGGGWWYASCSDIKPTAPLTSSRQLNTLMTMFWTKGNPHWVSLKEIKLMFRSSERSSICMTESLRN